MISALQDKYSCFCRNILCNRYICIGTFPVQMFYLEDPFIKINNNDINILFSVKTFRKLDKCVSVSFLLTCWTLTAGTIYVCNVFEFLRTVQVKVWADPGNSEGVDLNKCKCRADIKMYPTVYPPLAAYFCVTFSHYILN